MTNYKWNISLKTVNEIAYSTIKNILLNHDNFKIKLNLLIDLLIDKTKHISIKNYKKRKNIINFIRVNYGSIQEFIIKYPNIHIENNIYVSLKVARTA